MNIEYERSDTNDVHMHIRIINQSIRVKLIQM